MVTGYTYSTYVTQLATLAVVDEDDVNFQLNLPSAISSAELRILQDLDLLETKRRNIYTLTANFRGFTFPIDDFVVVEQVNIITPYAVSSPDEGTRNPCTFVDKTVLDVLWPSVAGATLPTLVAMGTGQNQMRFGPWPDQAYTIEILGTSRPDSLSASKSPTFISTYFPDLFMAASMIYISGYQRNFGRQSDDPQMAVSWQSFYKERLTSSVLEEQRKKFQAAAWSSLSAAVTATPERGMYPKAPA
jgi:hypothetical protein